MEPNPQKKQYKTLGDRIRGRIELTKIVFSLLSVLLFTAFSVIMIVQKWGTNVYFYLIVSFIALYILIFIIYMILIKVRGGKVNKSLKDYKSGFKIFKGLLAVINFGLTASIFSFSLMTQPDMSQLFQITVLVVSLVWGIFQIVYQVTRILKRHNIIKKKKKKNR